MEQRDLSRFEVLRDVLLGPEAAPPPDNALVEIAAEAERDRVGLAAGALCVAEAFKLRREAERLARSAYRKRRPISTLHILTTESAGMTEGYIQTWIETEMALVNVVRANRWEQDVQDKLGDYRTRINAIAEKVVADLGMEAVVQEIMSENAMPRAAALGMLLATNRPVADEVSRIAVLLEEEERQANRPAYPQRTTDPSWVDAHLKAHRDRLALLAIPKVVEANGRALELAVDAAMAGRSVGRDEATLAVIEADEDFKADLEFYLRSIARQEVIEELDRRFPELNILKT